MPPSSVPRNPNRPMRLSAQVPALMRKAYERFGFAHGQVLAHWPEIVGAELAAFTRPERIRWPRHKGGAENMPAGKSGGTLVVRVDGPAAIEVQHTAPQIIERINSYYGYGAIVSLRLVQGPVARSAPKQEAPPPHDEAGERRLAEKVAGIADPDLRSALSRLGRSIMFAGK